MIFLKNVFKPCDEGFLHHDLWCQPGLEASMLFVTILSSVGTLYNE
jgi:hypothetical protein